MPPTAAEKTWENCLTQISDQIPKQSFRTWFAPITPLSLEQDDDTARLRLAVPDAFHTEWLESHYAQVIRNAAAEVVGLDTRITYEVANPSSRENLPSELDRNTATHAHPPPSRNGSTRHVGANEMRAGGGASREKGASQGDGASQSQGDGASDSQGNGASDSQADGASHGEAASLLDGAGPGEGGCHGNGAGEEISRRLESSQGDGESGHARWVPTAAPQPSAASDPTRQTAPQSMTNRQPVRIVDNRLKPEYTFDSFIEGDCNRLARSAAVAISQNPGGTSFNPFMVYGGVGLGKTHIVQAIGNRVTQSGKAQRVLYVSSEQFTSQFVRSIQENRISDFSNFYRQIDLLIVDDVQFFGGKEKTQEEFFHVFNELHQTGKQIILCADRPPSEISGIEERLLSRFKWGLSADIQPPDLETRIAILQHKSAKHGTSLHPRIIDFVAERIRANIRQLEGALLKLAAHADLYDREIDLDAAKEILRDMIDDYQVRLEIEDIQRSVAQFYGVATELLSAKTRKREIVTARHVAMFFSKQLTSHSLKSIGLRFGGRDHSTVIHACNTIEDRIELEPAFRDEVAEIEQRLERRTPTLSNRHHAQMGVA